MSGTAYGEALGARFRIANPPSIVSTDLLDSTLAVTELESPGIVGGQDEPFVSTALPYDDAFLAGIFLREHPRYVTWIDGKPLPAADVDSGQLVPYDLRRSPRAVVDRPLHSVNFYLPRAALEEVADSMNRPLVGDLDFRTGETVNDKILSTLAVSILPALRRPHEASRLYVHHVLVAFAAHVAQSYGGVDAAAVGRGGLAPRQLHRACELLSTHLSGDISLKTIAETCGLSIGSFSRAFKESTGVTPHKWLLQRRVDVAKEKMSDDSMPLVEVAIACGFADQSHMTRVFTRLVGISPGVWRRQTFG